MARSLRQADITRYHRLKNLVAEKILQVIPNLVREVRPVIEHCQKDTFDSQLGVVRPADSNQGVEEF